MIIMRIMGGLGNQMFQYALYEKLKCLGKEIKADTTSFYNLDTHRKYELNKFANVDIQEASEEEKQYYFEYAQKWCYRVEGRLFPEKKKVRDFERLKYCENVYKVKDAYIYGFWQSEKYFADIREIIVDKFKFPETNDPENIKFLKLIEDENSVSIHVRRGDYLSEANQIIYGNICTLHYYEQAIQYFEKKFKDVTFFVFSNDVEWARKNLQMKKAVFVEGNDGEKAVFDMMLMSRCRHNIIANSSFSWWGAWLNMCAEKEVVAPSRWINTECAEDIWCEGWKKIDG